ncbi:MAG: hypothetical protein A3J38_07265 [Gammaproteobacteria bacterium RIFCSPHIGHO2_12_FULL_45_9]|nr:MAG: hypothetical protein A3J38_07265 [Gammaproteobacteria bacterium RIFCSPHIGHO2_12_FULL_45_9]
MMFEKIVLIMAMPEEAAAVVRVLQAERCELGLNPCLHTHSYRLPQFSSVYLVVNGVDPVHHVARVGTTPAALVAYEVIQKLQPQLIISAGTAGGFAERGVEIGQVYLGERIICHDRYIPLNAAYEAYAKGNYPCIDTRALAAKLNLQTAVISSCNSFAISPREAELLAAESVVAKEMEAAAIAEVAMLHGVGMLAVKTITNLVGFEVNAVGQFEDNFSMALTQLVAALQRMMPVIAHSKGNILNQGA